MRTAKVVRCLEVAHAGESVSERTVPSVNTAGASAREQSGLDATDLVLPVVVGRRSGASSAVYVHSWFKSACSLKRSRSCSEVRSGAALRVWEDEVEAWRRPAASSLWSPSQSCFSNHNRVLNSKEPGLKDAKPIHWDAHYRFISSLKLPSPIPLLGPEAWLVQPRKASRQSPSFLSTKPGDEVDLPYSPDGDSVTDVTTTSSPRARTEAADETQSLTPRESLQGDEFIPASKQRSRKGSFSVPAAPSSMTAIKGSRLAQLVENGTIVLIKSSYLEDCSYNGKTICPRQKMAGPCLWSGPEALELWRKHGKCFFCAVSYSWLSPHHPDPTGFYLPTLVWLLGLYKKLWGLPEVAVFIDYCSLWQAGSKRSWNNEERRQFEDARDEIGMLFGHKAVTSIHLRDVPEDEPKKYDDRGWTYFETTMSAMKGGNWNWWVLENVDLETEVEDTCTFFSRMADANVRTAPLSPHRFHAELQRRAAEVKDRGLQLMTRAEDLAFLPELYQRSIWEACQKQELSWRSLGWGDSDMECLAEVLPLCQKLERLHLDDNKFTSDGMGKLIKIVPKLNRLKYLSFSGNPVCRDYLAVHGFRTAWLLGSRPASGFIT